MTFIMSLIYVHEGLIIIDVQYRDLQLLKYLFPMACASYLNFLVSFLVISK